MNGNLSTNVNLVLIANLIYLSADAAIDISHPEAGVRIDAGFPLNFDRNVREVFAMFDQSYEQIFTIN